MSLVNPGKSGILTVLALIIIVGIPGMIAYADSSDDTYYSYIDDSVVPDRCSVKGDSSASFAVTAVEEDNGLQLILDESSTASTPVSLDSFTNVYKYALYSSTANLSSMFSKIDVSTDLEVSSVMVVLSRSGSELGTITLSQDEDTGVFSYELSSVDAVTYADANTFAVVLTVAAGDPISSFLLDVNMYSSDAIFTEDIVELLVLVGGIVLLVIGTFALSFIDIGTPGKAIRSAGRGIRSAGRKINRRSR